VVFHGVQAINLLFLQKPLLSISHPAESPAPERITQVENGQSIFLQKSCVWKL